MLADRPHRKHQRGPRFGNEDTRQEVNSQEGKKSASEGNYIRNWEKECKYFVSYLKVTTESNNYKTTLVSLSLLTYNLCNSAKGEEIGLYCGKFSILWNLIATRLF